MWFPYPNDPMNGEVEIVHLTETEVNDIMSKSLERRTIYRGKDDVELAEIFNGQQQREGLVIAAVRNWRNFFDGQEAPEAPNGAALECTTAAKRLWSADPDFMAFIRDSRTKLAEIVEAEKAAQVKN